MHQFLFWCKICAEPVEDEILWLSTFNWILRVNTILIVAVQKKNSKLSGTCISKMHQKTISGAEPVYYH